MRLTLDEILNAVKGRLVNNDINCNSNDISINAVSADSRKIHPGSLFVPIKGPKYDGHDYICEAVKKGAVCFLSEKEIPFPGVPFVLVSSARKALLDLAAYYRRKLRIKVIAITGSAGKTTVKDMTAFVLSQRYNVRKTMGNFNNDIGLPLSVFQADEYTEILVLEMGMNHSGEIKALSRTAIPDMAVITHIGDAHMENFENREGILHAKLEILEGMTEGNPVLLNGDDLMLTGTGARKALMNFYPIYCYVDKREGTYYTDYYLLKGLKGTECYFNIGNESIYINLPVPGKHMVMNALLAAAAAAEMGLSLDELKSGLENFKTAEGRLSIIKNNGMTLLDDTYNANPASLRSAIQVTASAEGKRKVCILGDMMELGSLAREYHFSIGFSVWEAGMDLLIAIGPSAKWIYEGYLEKGTKSKALYFENKEAFLLKWQDILYKDDVVLVKASRGMAFEKIVEGLACKIP